MGAMMRPSPRIWPAFVALAASHAYCISAPVSTASGLAQDLLAHQRLLFLPIVLFIYYFVAWLMVGRDPGRGTIVPRYQPPVNLSPAAVRYVAMAGTDHKSVAAVLLELALKKCVSIQPEDSKFRITRLVEKPPADLAPEELVVFQKLFHPKTEYGPADLVNDGTYDPEQVVYMCPDNSAFNSNLVAYIQQSLTKRFEGKYFTRNLRFVAWGGGVSILLCLLSASMIKSSQSVLFLVAWFLFGALILGSVFAAVTVSLFKDVITGRLNPLRMLPAFLALAVFLFGFTMVLRTIAHSSTWVFAAVLVLVVVLNVVWACLLRAPTELGRRTMDEIAGFKQFLASVELDRLKELNDPRFTPGLLNQFLPYAVALDLKERWGDEFAASMTATAAK
jgi:Predicted membrane protein (DUF2207)